MKTNLGLLAATGVLTALITFLTTQVRSASQGQASRPAGALAAQADDAKEAPRENDEAAVRKATAAFVKALEKGDAKAVADSWTKNGEYTSEDGTTVRGRAALREAYVKAFAKNKKKVRLEITVESIRFPSKDTAVEEGYAKTYKGDADQPTTARYSVLHVREDGRWLMALLREWPDEGVSLRDLGWLIGTWEARTEAAQVRTAYEWGAGKNSIRCAITIQGKSRNLTATQLLMRDPRSGLLRSWLFGDDGGFGEATWARDGKRWVITATGVEADGGELTATNLLTTVNNDTFTWQSTERTLDGEELPNIPPIKVTRVK
jgi:uncharacterized protein (TIGR02246 family)